MAIPKAKATMWPILDFMSDAAEHRDEEIQEAVAKRVGLTKADREERLKNGIPRYKNRTAWGLVYLQDTNHLPSTRPYIKKIGERGSGEEIYRITKAGLEAHANSLL